MKKFIYLLSTFIFVVMISPTVSAAPDVLIDEIIIEQMDLSAVVVANKVIFESGSYDVPIRIERDLNYSIIIIEANFEPVSSQFFIKEVISATSIESFNYGPENKILFTKYKRLKQDFKLYSKKTILIKSKFFRAPRFGVILSPLYMG